MVNVPPQSTGFLIHFSARGGEWSPPLGGDSRGGIRSGRGGNAAWNITTIGLNTTVYLMVIWRQLFSSKTACNILSVRIFHKLDYCKQLNSPRSGKKFPLGGGQGTRRGGTDLTRGGNDLHSTVSPPQSETLLFSAFLFQSFFFLLGGGWGHLKFLFQK